MAKPFELDERPCGAYSNHQNTWQKGRGTVHANRFPSPLLFGVFFGGMLLASGVHFGLIVLVNVLQCNKFTQTNLPIAYWTLASAGLTLLSVRIIRNTYERPMRMLAEATRQVAYGDFSVFAPAIHSMIEVYASLGLDGGGRCDVG